MYTIYSNRRLPLIPPSIVPARQAVNTPQCRAAAGEPEVTALLPGTDGSLFIASTPRGAIYRLLLDHRAELFGTIEARYLWALADDGAGRVLTATGDPATLVRLDGSGEARVIFHAEAESHLTGLLP